MKIKSDIVYGGLKENKRLFWLLNLLASVIIIVALLFVFAYGMKYSAVIHLLYLPIILFAFLWKKIGGAISGFIIGFSVGLILFILEANDDMILFFNWGLRTVVFILIGLLSGHFVNLLLSQIKQISFFSSHHLDTELPNYRYFLLTHHPTKKSIDHVSITLQINNYESLIILLGSDAYADTLKNVYEKLSHLFPSPSTIVQVDNRRFWVDMTLSTYKKMRKDFSDQLEKTLFYQDEIPLYIDFSLGISLPNQPKNVFKRFRESDIAALHAKNNHLKYVVFHQEHERDKLYIQRLGELPEALKNGELFLVFQPVMDVDKQKTHSIEALIRWNKDGEILEPSEFIPFAEETRVIDQITEWVLDEVLKAYDQFKTIRKDIVIALNISQRNLFNPNLIHSMRQKIQSHGIKPGKLELEMTESTLMLNRKLTQSFLESFRSIGTKCILDDFGTGYSSLSCLRDLPVDKVKIDRDFTMQINESSATRMTVKTIINLAHYMGLEVIAEGVETKAILNTLKSLGCNHIQGFYFAKPMRLEEMKAWLEKENSS